MQILLQVTHLLNWFHKNFVKVIYLMKTTAWLFKPEQQTSIPLEMFLVKFSHYIKCVELSKSNTSHLVPQKLQWIRVAQ